MSAVDIILIVLIAAALIAAVIGCIKKKGGCGCVGGDCENCKKCINR